MSRQPKPKKNKTTPIYKQVMKDLQERAEVGLKTYGTYLQVFNGRDSLVDTYEELLDAACYIKQKIEEEKTNGR